MTSSSLIAVTLNGWVISIQFLKDKHSDPNWPLFQGQWNSCLKEKHTHVTYKRVYLIHHWQGILGKQSLKQSSYINNSSATFPLLFLSLLTLQACRKLPTFRFRSFQVLRKVSPKFQWHIEILVNISHREPEKFISRKAV